MRCKPGTHMLLKFSTRCDESDCQLQTESVGTNGHLRPGLHKYKFRGERGRARERFPCTYVDYSDSAIRSMHHVHAYMQKPVSRFLKVIGQYDLKKSFLMSMMQFSLRVILHNQTGMYVYTPPPPHPPTPNSNSLWRWTRLCSWTILRLKARTC